MRFYLSQGLQHAQRRWHRLFRGARREATAWLQVDDPYSVLLAERLPALVSEVGLDLAVVIVPPPDPAFTPDVERLRAWALRDASLLAVQHGLDFPVNPVLPADEQVALANAAVLADPSLERVASVGTRLFSGAPLEAADTSEVAERLAQAGQARRKAGHYRSAMLQYEGEWTWGVDRLAFVEDRLRAEGLDRPTRQAQVAAPDPGAAESLEFFFSFRSPYSYLAIDRVAALADKHGVPLRIRPVLPMVMRGLQVPKVKVLDIARDCSRLARHHGIPFGLISDPLGSGIARCLALFVAAEAHGLGLAWIRSAGRGIWSEGLDVQRDGDLRLLAERAGVPWEAARFEGEAHLDLAEANRQALLQLGLWGVPSFRYGAFSAWGQDRLELLDAVMASAPRGG